MMTTALRRLRVQSGSQGGADGECHFFEHFFGFDVFWGSSIELMKAARTTPPPRSKRYRATHARARLAARRSGRAMSADDECISPNKSFLLLGAWAKIMGEGRPLLLQRRRAPQKAHDQWQPWREQLLEVYKFSAPFFSMQGIVALRDATCT